MPKSRNKEIREALDEAALDAIAQLKANMKSLDIKESNIASIATLEMAGYSPKSGSARGPVINLSFTEIKENLKRLKDEKVQFELEDKTEEN